MAKDVTPWFSIIFTDSLLIFINIGGPNREELGPDGKPKLAENTMNPWEFVWNYKYSGHKTARHFNIIKHLERHLFRTYYLGKMRLELL